MSGATAPIESSSGQQMSSIESQTKRIGEGVSELAQININPQDTKKQQIPNSSAGIIFFILITTIFTIITYVTLPKNIPNSENLNTNTVHFTIYILILVIGNYFINLDITKAVCGEPQWANTMINTLVPWILLFGVINIILILFPGWLSPFANTFGFTLINIMGLGTLLKKILNLEKDNPKKADLDPKEKLVARGIREIYGNSSLFINEIPAKPDKFRDFVTTLIESNYFKKGITLAHPDIIGLYKLIQLKQIIGKYVWNILTGILVVCISYNFIINISCYSSVKQMKLKRDKHIANIREFNQTHSEVRKYYPFMISNNADENTKSASASLTQ